MKSITFFKIFAGVVFALALFASNLDQRILLAVILIGLLGTLFLAILPGIHFPKWRNNPIKMPKKKNHLPAMDEDDPLATALVHQITVILSCISRFNCFDAFFARISWIRRIAPLIRVIEKIIMAVVAFLVKSDARTTSVANEIIPRTKRMILNGLINARLSRRSMVSFFRCEKLFAPYLSRITSTCACDRPSCDTSSS